MATERADRGAAAGHAHALDAPVDVVLRVDATVPLVQPFFAELPYFLWGCAPYESAGDCTSPRDRSWTRLALQHRDRSDLAVRIAHNVERGLVIVTGSERWRAAHFLLYRYGMAAAAAVDADEQFQRCARRANCVAHVFRRSELDDFDRMAFFGAWKWIGPIFSGHATPMRLLMASALDRNRRAVDVAARLLERPYLTQCQRSVLVHFVEGLKGDREPDARADVDHGAWHAELTATFCELLRACGCEDDESMAVIEASASAARGLTSDALQAKAAATAAAARSVDQSPSLAVRRSCASSAALATPSSGGDDGNIDASDWQTVRARAQWNRPEWIFCAMHTRHRHAVSTDLKLLEWCRWHLQVLVLRAVNVTRVLCALPSSPLYRRRVDRVTFVTSLLVYACTNSYNHPRATATPPLRCLFAAYDHAMRRPVKVEACEDVLERVWPRSRRIGDILRAGAHELK